MYTKNELIERINLDYPSLVQAKAAYKKNDTEGCLDALIQHYVTRTSPEYFVKGEEVKQFKEEGIIADAEDVMQHYIYGHQFKGDIDWKFNATAETFRDNEWSWSLFRHIYWQPLARAYALTGDEKYAKEFISQLKSFAVAWPADPFLSDPEYVKRFKFPGYAWRTIEAGIRIYTTWLPCYILFRNSPSWDKEGWLIYLNMIHDHAEYLMASYTGHEVHSGNWLAMESTALLQMGIMFPEMKNAEKWKLAGYRQVMHELKYSFDNDGIHMERTPIYHMVASIAFLQAVKLCMANGIPVPPYALPSLVKSAEFLIKLTKPNLSSPMIGDADRNDLVARRSDISAYEGMNLSFYPGDLNEMRAYFKDFADLTGREDFRWFATARKEGHEPQSRNFPLVDAGIYVMRTGWSATDSYMMIHGVQLEKGERSAHYHNDAGHLELAIKGEDVLIDAGRFLYGGENGKDWRAYFVSANAHNTLYVDDHTMGEVAGFPKYRGVRTFCHAFRETKEFQMIDISHNGYAFMDDPVFHRRRVIRLAGDIYVIDDQLTGLGLAKHDFRLYFNFAPGDLKPANGNSWIYLSNSGREYAFTDVIDNNTQYSCLKGSEAPKGGWVSYGYSVREPIPQLWLSAEGPVPLRFISVISPAGITVSGKGDPESATLNFKGGVCSSLTLKDDIIEPVPKTEVLEQPQLAWSKGIWGLKLF
jgi:hypothetical protein